MLAYILRRLALILPTLFGIMLINFVLVQFVPGGPVEQILAQLEQETDVFQGIAGGGGEIRQVSEKGDYLGAQGLPGDFIADLVPLGIRKAVRDGTSFDSWTSSLIIVGYAIPGFLFAILLLVLFAGGS